MMTQIYEKAKKKTHSKWIDSIRICKWIVLKICHALKGKKKQRSVLDFNVWIPNSPLLGSYYLYEAKMPLGSDLLGWQLCVL